MELTPLGRRAKAAVVDAVPIVFGWYPRRYRSDGVLLARLEPLVLHDPTVRQWAERLHALVEEHSMAPSGLSRVGVEVHLLHLLTYLEKGKDTWQ